MSTFVLVHGGWHGGWCWKKVTPLLRAGGHEVYTPTLTGLGERSHLAHPDVNLETHIQDIVNAIEFEGLSDIILVGHSYGGIVVGSAASRLSDRIAQLIYLDALIPSNGRTILDLFTDYGIHEFVEDVHASAAEHPGGWQVSPPEGAFGIVDEDDKRWLMDRLTPQSLGTVTHPVSLDPAATAAIQHAFILCTPPGDRSVIAIQGNQVRDDPAWQFREIEACHDVMVTEPEALVEIFNDLLV